MKRVIINADDFGLTDSVNRGIIQCHEQGVVSSTTLLVTGEAAAAAAGLAGTHPRLGVGLHINLTSGLPVLPAGKIPSLVGEDGLFPGVSVMTLRLMFGRARRQELAAEVRAQIRLCRELGIDPTHIDSHHHVHATPRLRSVLDAVCGESGITKARGYHMNARSAKSLAITLAARVPVRGTALRTPDRFSGIEVMGNRDMAAALAGELAREGDTLEFMCHPARADERLSQVSSYNSLRQVELEALLSEGFKAALAGSGAKPISFADL